MKNGFGTKAGLFLLAIPCAGSAVAQRTANKEVDWTKKREFVYFLPKAGVAANVGQRILACPERSEDKPAIETVVTIVSEQGPDPQGIVRVDGRSGLLAKRTTKLTLSPDGTLTAFNATTEGQGGELVAAAIKAAVTVATLGAGGPVAGAAAAASLINGMGLKSLSPPAKPPIECKKKTKEALSELARVDSQIGRLEQSVAEGEAGTAEVELLKARREQQKTLQAKLTLTSDPPATFILTNRPEAATAITKLIPAIDNSSWFEAASSPEALAWLAKIPGRAGFIATLTPNKAMFDALAGDGSALSSNAQPYLFYRRPVPTKVAVQPCKVGTVQGAACTADESEEGKEISDSKKLYIPQLSGLYAIAIGNGGIFGSRQASAKFDASGAPIELEYGSGSAGPDFAKVLGAANEGVVTLRDADLAALKRAAEEASALKTIDEARKALAKAE